MPRAPAIMSRVAGKRNLPTFETQTRSPTVEAREASDAGGEFPEDAHGRGPAVLLFVFTLWQSFWASGIVYGWPALLLMLDMEGVYADRCAEGSTSCTQRTLAFNMVFTVGSVVNLAGGLVGGAIVDSLGAKLSMAIGVFLVASGSAAIGFANASNDVIWPLAFGLIGFAGNLVHLPSFSLGNVFGAAKGLVIASLVGCFSCSALAFQVMYIAYTAGNLSRRTVFSVHICILLVNMCISLWIWPVRPLKPTDSLQLSGTGIRVVDTVAVAAPSGGEAAASSACAGLGMWLQYVKRPVVLGVGVWITVQLWVGRCLMGWFNAELKWKDAVLRSSGGAGLNVEHHMTIFNVTQAVLGLVSIPLFGFIVARLGHRTAPFVATAMMSVTWLAFDMIPSEWPLYIVYLLSAVHRQFQFSTVFTFFVAEFPMAVFGKLSGLITLVAGIVCTSQSPLLDLTLVDLNGDFTILLSVQLAVAGAVLLASVVAFVCERRNAAVASR